MRWWRVGFAVVAGLFLALPAGAGEIEFGCYHALVIGNNDYRNLPKLQTRDR